MASENTDWPYWKLRTWEEFHDKPRPTLKELLTSNKWALERDVLPLGSELHRATKIQAIRLLEELIAYIDRQAAKEIGEP